MHFSLSSRVSPVRPPDESRKVAARDLAQRSGPAGGCWLLEVLNPAV